MVLGTKNKFSRIFILKAFLLPASIITGLFVPFIILQNIPLNLPGPYSLQTLKYKIPNSLILVCGCVMGVETHQHILPFKLQKANSAFEQAGLAQIKNQP